MSQSGPHEDGLTPDKAGSRERHVRVEPPLGTRLALVNLFNNDPEAGERKKWQVN